MNENTPTEAEKPTPLLSARALADALDVTSATVRRWVRTGNLTPAEITRGGYYRFDLERAKAELESLRYVRAKAAKDIHRDAENEVTA